MMQKVYFKNLFRCLIIFLFLLPQFALAGMATFSNRYEVGQFINKMADQYDFDPDQLAKLLNQVKIRNEILPKAKRPKESGTWYDYRNLFITPKRIDEGVAFWDQHAKTLAKAQKEYGVPPEIIIGILGVETQFGKHKGGYRIIDALATLAFMKNPRQKFFQSELAQYLLLTRQYKMDPLALKGSYAGAMGIPQFMPSVYRSLAVSADGKNPPDLLNNPDDAIMSVANYFNKHGWKPGQTVTVQAKVDGNDHMKLLNGKHHSQYTVANLMAAGVIPDQKVALNQPANLLRLRIPNSFEYWIVFNNFYTIMAYNHSPLYAMAVHQLGQGVLHQKNSHANKTTVSHIKAQKHAAVAKN